MVPAIGSVEGSIWIGLIFGLDVFSISYNVLNGEEFLVDYVKSVRECVDHINLAVQYVSNTGVEASPNLMFVLDGLRAAGLGDQIIEYVPNLEISPQENELKSRQLGLTAAVAAGATYFMTMDCDEFYVKSEFEAAKRYILDNEIEASSAPSYLHIKRPIWRSKLPDSTCVSFLSKVDENTWLILKSFYPTNVNPTRRINGSASRFHAFDESLITM